MFNFFLVDVEFVLINFENSEIRGWDASTVVIYSSITQPVTQVKILIYFLCVTIPRSFSRGDIFNKAVRVASAE